MSSINTDDGECCPPMNTVIFQTTHPSHTKKILYYHKDPTIRKKMFPGEHFGTITRYQPPPSPTSPLLQDEQIDPYTTISNPSCLTIIRGIPTSAEHLIHWLKTEPPLRFGICRMYWMGSDNHIAASLQNLTEQIVQWYKTHIIPPSSSSNNNNTTATFRLQCFPRELETTLGNTLLPHSFEFCPVGYDYVINAVTTETGCFYWQILPASCYWQNPHSAHRRQATCTEGGVCKATGKLWEALIATGLDNKIHKCTVVDIGAAPGGWTMYLAERGAKKVIAVDPADLHPAVFLLNNEEDDEASLARSNGRSSRRIYHIKLKAQDAIPKILELLNGESLDVVVSDMNVHPGHMAPILSPLLDILSPGGLLIVTLKFGGRAGGGEREESLKIWKEYLGEGFENVKLLWLLSNTVTERTVVAQKV